MYELTDKEFEKYSSNYMFRCACESAYRNGFTKEQMLSELSIMLIEKLEEDENQKIKEMMMSPSKSIFL